MRLIALLLVILAYSALAQGQATVYKSVDEQGVVTFSDRPPIDAAQLERLQIDTPPPSTTGEYEQNLEAMRDTTDRMAADRREREKHRAELRELQARTDAYKEPRYDTRDHDDYSYVSGYRDYYPGGGYRPGKPPWRPGHRPKPEHPIARPPLGPDSGQARPTQNNSQLMRPITGRR